MFDGRGGARGESSNHGGSGKSDAR